MRLLSVLLSASWFVLLAYWVTKYLQRLQAAAVYLVKTLNASIAAHNAKSVAAAFANTS